MFPPNTPNLIEVARTLWQPWWVFAAALGAVIVLTPVVRKLASRWGIYDLPEGLLKPHTKPIPYLGGVAIFTAWLAPVLIWALIGSNEHAQEIMAIIFGGAILLSLGLVDDLKEIKPTYRLLGEIAVAIGLFIAGVRFQAIPEITIQGLTFFSPGSAEFVAAGLAVQIMLIAGASNAINLLDGLDGLCSGVMVIIAVGFLLVATHIGAWAVPQWCANLVGHDYRFNKLVVVMALALTGAALGFLLYNYSPATIFLGDAGSTFLGYLAAVMMILFSDQPGLAKWFLAGLMIMGLPIFDTGLALVRRIRNRRRIFGGDRSHFYDQLVDRGLTIRKSVAVCYALTILAVAIAVGTLALQTRYMVVIYAGILVGVSLFAWRAGFVKVESSSADSSTNKAPQQLAQAKDSSCCAGRAKTKLVIMGAGGLARELANAVADFNRVRPQFQVLGFLDDERELHGQERLHLPILGSVEWLAEQGSKDLQVIPATGDGYVREKFAQIAKEYGIPLASIIHPRAIIGANCSIYPGVFIAAGSVITVNVSLGKCSLVNMGCTIAHDVILGSYSSVHPGARISGEVTIGDYAIVGTQAVILNKCNIGRGAVVAMGAVVAQDVPDYTLVAGNPARAVKKLNKR